ncbi:hypothetical protein CASFOL_012045 [Castilleja foliolosa]|uniref:NADH dehydrogenase subunit 1 n=1 Tax=Castilleja foliolosa TaxID=1961234 RepID=A0ABD3DP93_9LAMI
MQSMGFLKIAVCCVPFGAPFGRMRPFDRMLLVRSNEELC